MAIKINFGGATLSKPGAYSKVKSVGGGAPTPATGVVAIIGEATGGAPTKDEDIKQNFFLASQFDELQEKYKSGPIVDAAKVLFEPTSDDIITNGAQAVYVYKTNESTQSSLAILDGSGGAYGTIKSRNYGTDENMLAVTITSTGSQVQIDVTRAKDGVEESSGLIGNVVAMNVTHATDTLTIDGTSLTTSGGVNLNLADFPTIGDLVEYLNAQANFVAVVGDSRFAGISPLELDHVSATAMAGGLDIKLDGYVVRSWFENAIYVSFEPDAGFTGGLPGEIIAKKFLTGAVRGATSSTAIVNGLDEFKKVRNIQFVVPLFSRSATDVKADGLTDSASDWDISAINIAVKEHCKLMSNTKNRAERQGFVSIKDTFDVSKSAAANINSGLVSMVLEDTLILTPAGTLEWREPWATAAAAAGMHAGSIPGEPITFKYANVYGVRHTDFDSTVDYDEAIEYGLLFLEQPASGGFRWVVGNTTYGKDADQVWNRSATVYAAFTFLRRWRAQLENRYTGRKTGFVSAQAIKNFFIDFAREQLAAGLIVGDDTNDGRGWKNLTIEINGVVGKMSVVITPVQGVDFLLSDIGLDTFKSSI